LANQVDAEAVVRLLGDELEAGLLVDLVRRMEDALRPECDFFVSSGTRELEAFGYKGLA
jgi:hypothetical protein